MDQRRYYISSQRTDHNDSGRFPDEFYTALMHEEEHAICK